MSRLRAGVMEKMGSGKWKSIVGKNLLDVVAGAVELMGCEYERCGQV